MRYEAPYCPWCPAPIRAWREGQPFGQMASVADSNCQIALPRPASPRAQLTVASDFDERVSERIAEIVQFATGHGYRKIGIATCGGSEGVVEALSTRLAESGFEVISAALLQNAVSESEPWLPALAALPATEPGCNPAAQARLLNDRSPDLNVAVGLCVGCDATFLRHAEAPTTVLCCMDSEARAPEVAAADCTL